MLLEPLRVELGDDYLKKIGRVFPFIETDEDITEFYDSNYRFNGLEPSELIDWVVYKVKYDDKVRRRIRPCLSDVQSVYPNVKTVEDIDIVISKFIKRNFGTNHFVYKGYFVFELQNSSYKRYFESFHNDLKEMLK